MNLHLGVPPLRQDNAPDDSDGERIQFALRGWHAQDAPLRMRDRQVEENIRMLAGQHYTVWSDLFGKFIDLAALWTEDEKRWRQRPAVNHLLLWFMLLHARLTENPPILTFQPATLDRIDAQLAEVADTIYKHVGREVGLEDVISTLFTWLIPSGEAYWKSRIDPFGGELKEWVGPAVLSNPGLIDEFGQPFEALADAVPYDEEGNPLAELREDGTYEVTGEPHAEHEGVIALDVLSCLEIRGQWGASIPWHKKRVHMQRAFLTPEEIWDLYGVECAADTHGDQSGGGDELKRILFGDGFFGAAGARAPSGYGASGKSDGYVEVIERWERPGRFPGMEETTQSPGGRLLVVTANKVLRDGPRPFRFRHTSPIRQFRFVPLPGRPSATSPQEMLNPIQRAYNRGWAQFLEHRNLCTNPIGIIDNGSGILNGQITNKPGSLISATRRPSVPALEFVAPPSLGTDSYKIQDMLGRELRFLGNIDGGTGETPHQDASGELVKELRFNGDRFIGPTAKSAVVEIARTSEDWMVMLPVLWDMDKMITVAGEDNVARTVTVLPELLEGKVHAFPDVESMLPEGRGERQAKVRQMYQDGIFGPPGSPPAARRYLELSRFPHLSRAARPGGVHRSTAEQQLGQLLQGALAEELPVFPWYDSLIHLETLEEFMSSMDFLSLDPEIQEQIVLHHTAHQGQLMAQAAEQLAMQNAAAGSDPDASTGPDPRGEAASDPSHAPRSQQDAPAAA